MLPSLQSMAIVDSCDTIDNVTQDTSAGFPPPHGRLSAINVESLSAINGSTIHRPPATGMLAMRLFCDSPATGMLAVRLF